jgi:hypothetical protein
MDVEVKDREKFRVGETWWSYDNGLTFTRQQASDQKGDPVFSPYMRVTKIDHLRGELTLSGAWTDATGTYPPQGKQNDPARIEYLTPLVLAAMINCYGDRFERTEVVMPDESRFKAWFIEGAEPQTFYRAKE